MLPALTMAQYERRANKAVKVYFLQSKTKLDENYKNNGESLREFAEAVKELQQDRTANFEKLRIIASTSPEGAPVLNGRISKERAAAIVKWLENALGSQFEYTIEENNPDWKTLVELVQANNQVPNKEEVLDILCNTPEQQRYQKLISLRGGRPYIWLFENLFPDLRYSTALVEVYWETTPVLTVTSNTTVDFPYAGGNSEIKFTKNVSDFVIPTVTTNADWIKVINATGRNAFFTVDTNTVQSPRSATVSVNCYNATHNITVNQQAAPQPEPAVEPQPEEPQYKPFYMAAKTNMLYLLGAVPNVGLEFALGKGWSIAGNWEYAWWKNDNKTTYWRVYGGDLAVRKWWGKANKENPLSGHHAGVYGQIITYDFILEDKGWLADKWSYSVGVEYGYSLPIARRLNIDFNVGVGYHTGEFKEYIPIDGHYVWQTTKQRFFIGPTKLEAALVWLIGRGNCHKNKGGNK